MDAQMDGWRDGHLDKQTDGHAEGMMEGHTAGLMFGWSPDITKCNFSGANGIQFPTQTTPCV